MNLNELPAWAGKALFGVTTAGLLVLGGWVMTGSNGQATTQPPVAKPAPAAAVVNGSIVPPPGQGTGVPPGAPGSSLVSASPLLGNLDMPLSGKGLVDTAALANQVMTLMNSHQWNEDPKAWAQALRPLVSGDAVNTVAQAVPSGAVLAQYTAQKMTTVATATIAQIRLVAIGQAVFDVAVSQDSRGSKGAHVTKANYWVSVDTTKKQVTSIQPAGTGN